MSLTALSRYDDAEDEIKDEDHDLITKKNTPVVEQTEESQSGSESRPPSTLADKPRSLVSYIGGEYSDDEHTSDEEEGTIGQSVPLTKTNVVNLGLYDVNTVLSSAGSNSPIGDTASETNDSIKEVTDSIRLPPEPEGRCSKSIQEKVTQMIEKKRQGFNVNEYVQNKKEFRNPSIYEKLVSFIGIDEHGTNFPKHLYDPSIWGADSYYDALAKAQKEHHEKKEKEKLKRTHVEFVKGTKPSTNANPPPPNASTNEKKSKWDQKIPPSLQKVIKANEQK